MRQPGADGQGSDPALRSPAPRPLELNSMSPTTERTPRRTVRPPRRCSSSCGHGRRRGRAPGLSRVAHRVSSRPIGHRSGAFVHRAPAFFFSGRGWESRGGRRRRVIVTVVWGRGRGVVRASSWSRGRCESQSRTSHVARSRLGARISVFGSCPMEDVPERAAATTGEQENQSQRLRAVVRVRARAAAHTNGRGRCRERSTVVGAPSGPSTGRTSVTPEPGAGAELFYPPTGWGRCAGLGEQSATSRRGLPASQDAAAKRRGSCACFMRIATGVADVNGGDPVSRVVRTQPRA